MYSKIPYKLNEIAAKINIITPFYFQFSSREISFERDKEGLWLECLDIKGNASLKGNSNRLFSKKEANGPKWSPEYQRFYADSHLTLNVMKFIFLEYTSLVIITI